MLPLPEHLQRSLSELNEYYQHLQEDYAAKLEGVQRQVLAIEALQSGGGIAPPPEMVVHLQELERYYTRALSEVAEQESLATTQRDRVEAIIGSTERVSTPDRSESVTNGEYGAGTHQQVEVTNGQYVAGTHQQVEVTPGVESGSSLQEVTPYLEVAGDLAVGVSPSGGIASKDNSLTDELADVSLTVTSQVQEESTEKELVWAVVVEPDSAELPLYLPQVVTPESSNVEQVIVESDVLESSQALREDYYPAIAPLEARAISCRSNGSNSFKESPESESVEIATSKLVLEGGSTLTVGLSETRASLTRSSTLATRSDNVVEEGAETELPPEITLLKEAVVVGKQQTEVVGNQQTYVVELEGEVESVEKGNTDDTQSSLCHITVKDIHSSHLRRKVMPTELLNQFLMSLHPSTRSALNVCKTSGNLYIEEQDGVTTLFIVPNDRDLDKRIGQRLSVYQERFNAFLGKPSSVVHISTVPITPLSPEYLGLSLQQAIAKLLTTNRGIILHREYIVREIYGELPREVKPNTYRKVSQTLKAGVTQRLWDADPDNQDCYTINYPEIVKPD